MPQQNAPTVHALEVNYHALLASSPDTVILLDLDHDRIVDANRNAATLFGRPQAQLLHCALADLCPLLQPDGRASAQAIRDQVAQVEGGAIRVFELTFQHADGRHMDCEMRLVKIPNPGTRLMHARVVDVTRRKLAEVLRAGQGRLLEMIARGAPLAATLEQLTLLIETQSPGVLCSVLLLDEDGTTIHPGAGPSLPKSYIDALEGRSIGPLVGSCGTAMFRKQTVIVGDIRNDPLWEPYKALVEPHGLRACWSTPIFDDRDQVLGSFAMYYREVRSPDADDMRVIGIATHLAGIAIERTRREKELVQHRHHLEELVAARTAQLTAANGELATALESLRLSQDELVRRAKLAALGTLVAGIAHEMNTPIGNSLVVATTLAERTGQLARGLAAGLRRSDLEAYLGEADMASELLVRNLQRAANLVQTFKQIAVNHASSQRRRFSLAQTLRETLEPLSVSLGPTAIRVEQDIDRALQMDSYPGPLMQVVANLFDNCVMHAFGERATGRILISAKRRAPGVVTVSIADDGIGIAPENMARVYDPFFTTRLGAGGSGLGLHITHNIVSGVLGGRIELASEIGRGSTFTLVLPETAPSFTGPLSAP